MNRAKFAILFLSGAKRVLIAQGILILVPLPTNGAKLLPRTENFQPITVKTTYVFKFSDPGSDLTPLIGNGTKFKTPSEITVKLRAVDQSTTQF
jgi:hypothetical protein